MNRFFFMFCWITQDTSGSVSSSDEKTGRPASGAAATATLQH